VRLYLNGRKKANGQEGATMRGKENVREVKGEGIAMTNGGMFMGVEEMMGRRSSF